MTAVYLWREGRSCIRKYERRITICRATDELEATERLLREAKQYPIDVIEFLDDYKIQEIDAPPSDKPIEVAHEMSLGINPKSGRPIPPEVFLSKIWECSRIRDCEALGIDHSWYNHDGERSACHNCEVIREGKLWRTSKT